MGKTRSPPVESHAGLNNERYLGEHICERRYAIRNKTGNQSIFVRNKAIPTRAREQRCESMLPLDVFDKNGTGSDISLVYLGDVFSFHLQARAW